MTDVVALVGRTSDRAHGRAAGAQALARALSADARVVGEPGRARARGATTRTCATRARRSRRPPSPSRSRSGPLLTATDCSICVATVPAVARRWPDAWLLWLDAHGDFNTPDTTPSGFLGGMCLAGAVGLWDTGYGAGPGPEKVVLVGGRDLDAAEEELMARHGVVRTDDPAAALAGREVFVHLDVDILDPTVMPGQLYPAPGGLDTTQLHDLLADVAARARIVGARDHLLLDPRAQRRTGAGRRAAAGEPRTMSTDAPPSILRPLVEDLHERRARAKLGGGEEKIAKQHAADKLTARERLELLVDPGTFTELGLHAGIHYSVRALEGKEAPADGVITGYGKVDGRLVAVVAYDFTVMAGSMGMTGEVKVARLRELALTKRLPFVWLLDSAGARIQEAVGSLFAGSGHLFREEVVMSGVIPQVAALMGPCAAGTAYIPGLADFVPMVKGRGSMALAGPHLVRAAVGEDVTQEELGGSRVHCRKSGVGDLEVADDQECIARIKQYLSYMPSHNREAPPPARDGRPGRAHGRATCSTSCPESNRKPYDMYEVIRRIVDDGEWLDLKPQWAKTIITCFARFGGRPVGIVANQPRSSAASSTTTRPTRRRGSSTSATPSGCRSSS